MQRGQILKLFFVVYTGLIVSCRKWCIKYKLLKRLLIFHHDYIPFYYIFQQGSYGHWISLKVLEFEKEFKTLKIVEFMKKPKRVLKSHCKFNQMACKYFHFVQPGHCFPKLICSTRRSLNFPIKGLESPWILLSRTCTNPVPKHFHCLLHWVFWNECKNSAIIYLKDIFYVVTIQIDTRHFFRQGCYKLIELLSQIFPAIKSVSIILKNYCLKCFHLREKQKCFVDSVKH